MLVAVICYTTFQAFFTYNLFIVRTVMFVLALEASYLITKVSISASRLANEVSCKRPAEHFNYFFTFNYRLIALTGDLFESHLINIQLNCKYRQEFDSINRFVDLNSS